MSLTLATQIKPSSTRIKKQRAQFDMGQSSSGKDVSYWLNFEEQKKS